MKSKKRNFLPLKLSMPAMMPARNLESRMVASPHHLELVATDLKELTGKNSRIVIRPFDLIIGDVSIH